MKSLNIVSGALVALLFSGCIGTSHSPIIIKNGINSRFYIGKDVYTNNKGLWYLKAVYPADTSANFEGQKYHYLLFSTPTGVGNNNEFIILKRELPKESVRYMIVKMRNDSLIRYYPVKNEKKFNELRHKLNVPDSLQFKPLGN